ncbi:hypothetical protein HY333_00690 [Candidatus Collierbacteria bacterium]|nr:hypothetical protein [Candidatus Collierbacteria bacterium]
MTTRKDNKKSTGSLFGFKLPEGSDEVLLRQTVLTFTGMGFLVMVAVVFVLPKAESLRKLWAEIKTIDNRVKNYQLSLTSLDEFRLKVAEDDGILIKEALPGLFDPALILTSLKKNTFESGVALKSFKLAGGELELNKEEKGKNEKTIIKDVKIRTTGSQAISHQIEIVVSGEAVSMLKFVNSIGRTLPVSIAEDLNISEISNVILGRSGKTSQMEIKLKYFHLPERTDPIATLEEVIIKDEDIDLLAELKTFSRLEGRKIPETSTEGKKGNLFEL